MLSNIYLSARKAVVTNQKKEDLGVNGHKDEGRSIEKIEHSDGRTTFYRDRLE